MSILNYNNSQAYFTFKQTEGFEYVDLETLYKEHGERKQYLVNALYVNENGQYGQSPLVVGSDQYINLPSHMVEQVEQIRADEKIVEDINNGKVGFVIYEYYQKKYKKTCYGINWIELDDGFIVETENNIPF